MKKTTLLSLFAASTLLAAPQALHNDTKTGVVAETPVKLNLDQLYINGVNFNRKFTDLDFTSSNLTSIATRNFSDLQNKPTTVAGYRITDTPATWVSRQVLGADSSSVTFSSIPQTYRNLRILFCGQSDQTDGAPRVFLRFNGDSNVSHYFWQYQTVGDHDADNNSQAMIGRINAEDVDALGGSMFELVLPNYAGGFTKNYFSNASYHDINLGQLPITIGGQWDATPAITSVAIFPEIGKFVAGTTVTLILEDGPATGGGDGSIPNTTDILIGNNLGNALALGSGVGVKSALQHDVNGSSGLLTFAAIGTNVQAYDADLTTWSGITPGTGVGTALGVNVGSAGAFGRQVATPSTASSTGTAGDYSYDSSFFYICTASNTWKRVAIASW